MIKHPASFRDPKGFIFIHEKRVYRQVNFEAREDYDLLHSAGLYEYLTSKNVLIKHDEVQNFDDFKDFKRWREHSWDFLLLVEGVNQKGIDKK